MRANLAPKIRGIMILRSVDEVVHPAAIPPYRLRLRAVAGVLPLAGRQQRFKISILRILVDGREVESVDHEARDIGRADHELGLPWRILLLLFFAILDALSGTEFVYKDVGAWQERFRVETLSAGSIVGREPGVCLCLSVLCLSVASLRRWCG